ncbi:mas-related G-protein coupled receptor member H-like [Caloenas nicobarica]|uniref:mas-related G-protein coupled receptor member H-like n=1 Tax=Caloenas nicobarica TaxID=187106 RepID=UPI0032B7D7ED
MEETNTTEMSLDYVTSGCVNNGETLKYECLTVPFGLKVFGAVCVGISLCGLVGNMLVVWFLGFHIKKSPFTVYVLNLAIADFSLLLFLLAILPLYIITELYCNFLLKLLTQIIHITSILFLFWYFASMYLLTAISIERCLSVLFPIWYRCHRPRHLSGIVCGVLWTLAGLFIPLLIICYLNSLKKYFELLQCISIGNSLIFSLLPLFSNLFLFIRLRCGSQRRHPGRLYITILLSAIFLFLFGFPLSVGLLLSPYCLDLIYLNISSLLSSLNSSINPLIYFLVGSWRQRRFQGSIKVAFQRVFEEKAKNEKNHVPGDTTAATSL